MKRMETEGYKRALNSIDSLIEGRIILIILLIIITIVYRCSQLIIEFKSNYDSNDQLIR